MGRKLLLLTLALVFAAAANMSLCCTVTVEGRELEGVYPLSAVDRGWAAASAAAEEILSGPAGLPELEKSYRLSLRPARGESAGISSAVLESTPGVELNQGVYVNSVYLGSVEQREELLGELRQFITGQLPSWAQWGYLSQELSFREQYGSAGSTTPVEDMVLLISGMAPVMYSDGEGYVAMA